MAAKKKKTTAKKSTKKTGYTKSEADAYSKAYSSARKTKAGSPKALHGGTVADKAGKAAVSKMRKKGKK